jgi:hypothetical protein
MTDVVIDLTKPVCDAGRWTVEHWFVLRHGTETNPMEDLFRETQHAKGYPSAFPGWPSRRGSRRYRIV